MHDNGIDYANHPDLSNKMTDARLDTVLEEAPLRAGRSDYSGDLGWTSGSKTELTWTLGSQASTSSVHRGTFQASGFDPNWPCLAGDIPGSTYTDSDVPTADSGYHYLVTCQNVCGTSGAGTGSDGDPRTVEPCP